MFETTGADRATSRRFGHWNLKSFEFVSDFELRASDLELGGTGVQAFGW
jgi:hypothetical protein